jgi:hypothetical protein
MKTTLKSYTPFRTLIFFMMAISALSLSSCKKETSLSTNANGVITENATLDNGAITSNSHLELNVFIPFWVPCANNGQGEVVPTTGTVKLIFTLMQNDNNYILKTIAVAQGIGVGEVTGDTYVGRESSTTIVKGSFINGESKNSYVNSYKLIGKGGAVNSMVKQTINLIINSNGIITASVDYANVVCGEIYTP